MNHLSSRKVLCLFIQIGFLFDATTFFLDHLVFKKAVNFGAPWLAEAACLVG